MASSEDGRGLLRIGIIGTVLAALCCFTPILVVLLGAVGLAALTGYLDYVLFPALLGASVEVESSCRATGAPVRLTVTPRGVESAEPAGLSVSFLLPEAEAMNANVITSFCHYVHFFSSRKAAKPWLHQHPETFLLSLVDAYEFGRRMNRTRYGTALRQPPKAVSDS